MVVYGGAGDDAEFQLWDITGDEPTVTDRRPLPGFGKSAISTGAICGNGKRVGLFVKKGQFAIFDIKDGKLTEVDSLVDSDPSAGIRSIAWQPFTADGRYLLYTHNSGYPIRDVAEKKIGLDQCRGASDFSLGKNHGWERRERSSQNAAHLGCRIQWPVERTRPH